MTKKISFKNAQNKTLVATVWEGSRDAIVIMAHGSTSNRFARGLFEPIAKALQHQYTVLAFDFSGHGESDDAIFNTARSVEDLNAAVEYAKTQGYKRIALFGHSFGALACCKAFTPDIQTMVLLGPLVGPVKWKWEEYYTAEQLQQIRQEGYITSPITDGTRTSIKTDVAIFDEILAIDQKQLLHTITCPVLMIHGDADEDELNMLEFSKKALPLLPKGSELVVIPGASHSFVDHANQVIALTKGWLSDHFSA